MFDSLQTGLKGAFKSLAGQGKLTESNMRDGLKLVEQSLLEADVSYSVVQEFMGRVTEQALGEKVLLSLKPSEQLIHIVHSELINLLGPTDDSLQLNHDVNIFMMCGLQGSGKTTTCGKLAKLLSRQKIKPLLVAADLQRPAAIDQLHVLGEQLDVPVYSDRDEKDPVKVCRDAVAKARAENCKVVILDTAGRLAIDEELMEQLKTIDREVQPHQVFLVVDGMTGQDAVNSAGAFHEALELNGVIMTKLDGDARGGALLSVRHVTGVPVKFMGTGEHLDDLEPFRGEGMASRILGGGDMQAMVDIAGKAFDEEEQKRLQENLEKGKFTLDDFRNHMIKMAKPGLMTKMLGLLPGMPNMGEMAAAMNSPEATKEIRKMCGIIDSMTQDERTDPSIIEPQRRQRIAKGAGVQPKAVNELVKQFNTMKPMLTGMASGNMSDKMAQIEDLKKQMMDPSSKMKKPKKSTGKRLTAKEKAKLQKDRKKLMKDRKKKCNKCRKPMAKCTCE
jgi:signal recognition particle subunit SRP54